MERAYLFSYTPVTTQEIPHEFDLYDEWDYLEDHQRSLLVGRVVDMFLSYGPLQDSTQDALWIDGENTLCDEP